MKERARRHADLLVVGALLLLLGATRWLAVRRGLVFNIDILDFGYQFLDPLLLKTDLLRSLWHLHSQPPGFNLFLGLILKIAPGTGRTLFAWSFRLLSVLMIPVLYDLQRRMDVPRWLAALVTALVILSPGVLLYENWLFYTHPVAVVLVLAAWFFARFAGDGRTVDGLGFFLALAGLVYLRSIFHPVWFLAMVGLAVWSRGRDEWRRCVLLAAGPFLLVLGLFAKNGVLFGEFTSSTWLGMSAAKMATTGLTEEEWDRLRSQPDYPAILDIPTFESVARCQAWLQPQEPTGIPALDDVDKSTGYTVDGVFHPFFNLNHLQSIQVSRRYGEAAGWVICREPMGYLRSVNLALVIFFKPTSEYLFLAQTPGRIRGYERTYNLLVHGKVGEHSFIKEGGAVEYGNRRNDWLHIGFLIPPLVLVPLAYAGWLVLGALRGRRLGTSDKAVLFLAMNMAWVMALGVLLEVGENNRFRAMMEPANWAALAAVLARLVARLRPSR